MSSLGIFLLSQNGHLARLVLSMFVVVPLSNEVQKAVLNSNSIASKTSLSHSMPLPPVNFRCLPKAPVQFLVNK